ncbi:MAG: peptide ABC transporter substrate-binding protein [Candidatus Faecousia sp.]|nr:peptide ABC transporter substrate-binding protein [Clostridiales bacterium]MDY6179283.1 peptide ABC transporter substrate-binding protein [Candidatus Faecousia sp.]
MKKLLCMLLALAMVLSLAACGGSGSSETTATTAATEAPASAGTETAAPAGPSSISVCLSSEPDTIDPALNSAVDGATLTTHLFAGLSKWAQDENGNLVIEADCATELTEGVMNDDGTVTYTYTLRDGLKWSDGADLTAGDFVFAWKRAASTELGADYGYMYEVVKGYPDDLAVEAPDDKTIVVTLNNAVAYWNELLAFPAYFPVREDVVADEAWATDPSTYISNGAYTMTGWDHNSKITLTKNPNYYNADAVTMDEIVFYLSDDANNMLSNFKNGEWLLIDDVPTNEIAALKTEYPDEFKIAGQIGTYYVCWNINEEILPAGSDLTGAEAEAAKAEIRNAIALLFDRNYIAEEIGQAGQVPASSFVAMGMTDADGSEFYKNAGDNADFDGYYNVSADAYMDNWASAIETLKKYYAFDESTQMFTNFPTLTYLYNTSEGHKAIGEYLASAMASVGITMNLENQEWNTFLNTRKNGDYSVARNGWLADYNDPICFLDMWVTASGNNDVQFGKGEHADVALYSLDLTDLGYDVKVENGTWAETYDVIINLIKTCTDTETRYALMHRAEDLLMSTGCIVPLYFYTDIYMISSSVKGFFSNPLGYKYFMYCTIE